MDFVPKNNVSATQVLMPEEEVFEKKVSAASRANNTRVSSDVKRVKAQKISTKPSAVMGRGMVDSALKKPISKPVRAKEPVRKVSTPAGGKSKEELIKKVAAKADDLDRTMKVPKARFVNTEKVAKRPLSKNIYQRKIVEPKEEPQGPVTIIQKPEKDSKVGLIVTIIITIILGAAAGTVAFLLLPK
jgi:hypothetical protein